MKSRCHDKNHRAYANYGGRGVRVCAEWRHSFESFLSHVGIRPDPKMTLDRIDNSKGYEPGNVRWATRIQQAQNTRWTKAALQAHGRRNAMRRWHPELASE